MLILQHLKFPWQRLERGQGFFVPCLDVEAIKAHGLRKAVGCRMLDARAKVGIYKGVIGVLFYRLPPVRS